MNADLEILEHDIDASIENYEQKRKVNRNRSALVSTTNTFMAALTTVLIGVSNVWQPLSKTLMTAALITSAFITIISGWDRIFNHKKLWQIYTNSWIALRLLKMDVKHLKKTRPRDKKALNSLYIQYKRVISDLNDKWNSMKITERE